MGVAQLIIIALAERAASQHGLVSTADFAELEIAAEQVRHRVDQRWLIKLAPRVVAVAGSPDTHERQLQAGLLSLGPSSWVSYEAAAALHGFDRSEADAVEFTVERTARNTPSCFAVHTTARIDRLHRVTVAGFRTMSATRTILDLAHARGSQSRVAAALDSAVRLGISHPTVLAKRLAALRGSGRWGCRLIDRLLPDSGGHSPLERAFLGVVRSIDAPPPQRQVVQRTPTGRHIARVDFLFPDHRLIVEVNGRRGHVSDVERTKDAQRRNELQALGFRVVEYTTDHLRQRRAWVAADLLLHLGSYPESFVSGLSG
jgi:hypothetical protein